MKFKILRQFGYDHATSGSKISPQLEYSSEYIYGSRRGLLERVERAKDELYSFDDTYPQFSHEEEEYSV